MAGRWRSSAATPSPWPSCAAASTPTTAARCAWPATARTAWPRSTASPTSAPARRRPGPGLVVRRHPAVGGPGLPVAQPTAAAAQTAPSTCTNKPMSSWSAPEPAALSRATGPRRPAATCSSSTPRRGDEVVAHLQRPDGRSSAGPATRHRAAAPPRPRGDRSPPARRRSIPVCPGNQLRGIVTARAAGSASQAGVDLGRRGRRRRTTVDGVPDRVRPLPARARAAGPRRRSRRPT